MGSPQASHWINGFRLDMTWVDSSPAWPVHEAGRLPRASPWAAQARLIAILSWQHLTTTTIFFSNSSRFDLSGVGGLSLK
jgi:hypothetical protein